MKNKDWLWILMFIALIALVLYYPNLRLGSGVATIDPCTDVNRIETEGSVTYFMYSATTDCNTFTADSSALARQVCSSRGLSFWAVYYPQPTTCLAKCIATGITCATPTPTPSITPSPTPAVTPTPAPTLTPTPVFSITPTPTPSNNQPSLNPDYTYWYIGGAIALVVIIILARRK